MRKTHVFKTKAAPEETEIVFIFLPFTWIWGLTEDSWAFLSDFSFNLLRCSSGGGTWEASRLSRLCRTDGRRRSILIASPDNGVCFSVLKLNRRHLLKN